MGRQRAQLPLFAAGVLSKSGQLNDGAMDRPKKQAGPPSRLMLIPLQTA
jgi:hypothetical protein